MNTSHQGKFHEPPEMRAGSNTARRECRLAPTQDVQQAHPPTLRVKFQRAIEILPVFGAGIRGSALQRPTRVMMIRRAEEGSASPVPRLIRGWLHMSHVLPRRSANMVHGLPTHRVRRYWLNG